MAPRIIADDFLRKAQMRILVLVQDEGLVLRDAIILGGGSVSRLPLAEA